MIDISKSHTTNASLKIMLIMVAIFAVVLLSYPVKAESGNLNITENSQFTQYTFAADGGAIAPDFTKIAFNNANFNQIESLFINTTGTDVTFATSGRSTTFTITSGGSGGGVATYSEGSNAMAWYFTYPSTITGSPITLSYTVDIFADISFGAGKQFMRSNTGSTAVKPAVIQNTLGTVFWSGTCDIAACANPHTIKYDVVVDKNVGNTYSVTYQQGTDQLFTTAITKAGQTTVNTLVKIENATGTPINYSAQGDGDTLNNDDFTVINTYGQGIALNMSIASGSFTRVVINTTGSTPAPPTLPNGSDPNNPNCDVNCIETSKPIYNNTESVNIFGSFYPATTTTTECLFFGFVCEDTTISTESDTGYVFISTQGSTSPVKFISFTPDMNNNYNIFTNLDIGTYQAQLIGFAGPGSTCTNGIVYDFPFIPLGCYYPHNITTFNVVNASGNLSIVWQTKISNSTAIYGDTVTVAWSNVTANDTVVIYDQDGVVQQRYNINQSTVSQIPVFIPLFNIGQWNATIYNASDNNHRATAYLNVVPPGSVDVNNSYGITMYWNKAADVVNNPTLLNWNTGTYTGNYNISILQNGNEIRRNSYFGVPGQEQQGSYTFGEQGAYVAQFLDSPNETVQAQADIFISATTTTDGSTGGATNESGNNLVGSENLIMNIPWIGLMLLIVVIFGLVKNNVQGGNFVFAIAITTSIEAVLGLWEQWGIYITILSWLLVAVFFRLNKSIEV